MKNFKFYIFVLSIFMAVSACSLPNSAPADQGPTSTLAINTVLPTETATPISSTSTMTVTTAPTSLPTTATSSGTGTCVNSAEFVSDVSIPDGTNLMTDTDFVKTWRVKNTGTCTWDSRYSLVFTDGTLFSGYDRITLPFVVAPGQTTDLSLEMTSPIYPGAYESDWKFQSPNGSRFGVGKKDSPLWVKIVVGQQGGASISGFVYQDRNGNAKYDFDDQLMASREVWLQQGSCELGGTRIASGVSGGDGRYTITGNFHGKYCLSLQRPDETAYTLSISVTTGQRFDGADMQDAVPNLVISGKVWNDTSKPDGVQQSAEPNLSGVTVLLDLGPCASPVSLVPVSTFTDAQGNFSFGSLYGGTYCVSVRAGDGSNVNILGSGAWTMPASGAQQVTIRPSEQKSASFGWQFK